MRRAHNSGFPKFIHYRGVSYYSPTHLYRLCNSNDSVSLPVFTKRLRNIGAPAEQLDTKIDEALNLHPNEFRAKYGPRKTIFEVNGLKFDLGEHFSSHATKDSVPYSNFRSRIVSLRKRDSIDPDALCDALSLNLPDWISFYGGGRHKKFTYAGDLFPEHVGRTFHSISAFLKTIGRHEFRFNIWNRLKAGWDLDFALEAPTTQTTQGSGVIYTITRHSTKQVYVGLTFAGIDARWMRHLNCARRGATNRLSAAIRHDGASGFERRVLETILGDVDYLQLRERYWIETLDTQGALGLNSTAGGELGGPHGIPVDYNGERFPSTEEATRVLTERTGLASHVVRSRLLAGKLLPEKAREHNKHAEAGSPLFRRWLSLLRRRGDQVSPVWIESYDRFKDDVLPFDPILNLLPIDNAKLIGPGNFRWGTWKSAIEQTHGKSHEVLGLHYMSMEAIATAHGIGVSTLKYRVYKKGMSFEQAVSQRLGQTSFRCATEDIVVDGIKFRSKRQAILHIARTRGISEDAAKYGLSIGRF